MNNTFKAGILVVRFPEGGLDPVVVLSTNDSGEASKCANTLATDLLLKKDRSDIKTFIEDATYTAEIKVNMRKIGEISVPQVEPA